MKITEIVKHPLKAAAADWRDGTPVLKPIVIACAVLVFAMCAIWFGSEFGKSAAIVF